MVGRGGPTLRAAPATPPVPPPTDDEIRRRYGLPPGTRVVRSRGPVGEPVRVTPDAFHYREVESELHGGTWDRPVVVAGTTVHLTAQGVAVGEGSPVAVTLKDARNRTAGRGGGPMHRDRAVVAVEVDRRAAEREPDGALCAADVELPELGLKVVSAPLLVLPYAALDRAAWGQVEARDGDAVALSCRVTGSAAGVERLEGQTAEVEVLRGGEGGADEGGAAGVLFEPVATLRVPVTDGCVEAVWRVGYDAEGKAQIATQAELDEAAARSGGAAAQYARPAWRFRVRLAGLEAESGLLRYRDRVEFEFRRDDGEPYEGLVAVVEHPDGARTEHTVGTDGLIRVEPAPPGLYAVVEVREPEPPPTPDPPRP